MGGAFSRLFGKWFANREMRILMLGLDAAGKTSTTSQFHKVLIRSNSIQTQIESAVTILVER